MGRFNTRRAYWHHLRCCFEAFSLSSWIGLYQAIITGNTRNQQLGFNSSQQPAATQSAIANNDERMSNVFGEIVVATPTKKAVKVDCQNRRERRAETALFKTTTLWTTQN
jgi:hypothetical protein